MTDKSSGIPFEDGNRTRSKPHRRHSLEKAEEFGRKAFEVGPRNCDLDRVAQAVGYKNAFNGAFAALRGTATAFGIIRNSAAGISVSEDWIDTFHSEDNEQLRLHRQIAVLKPSLYKLIFQDFEKRQLPSLEKLTRTLHMSSKYGILKDAAQNAAHVFLDSVAFAGLIDNKGYLVFSDTTSSSVSEEISQENHDEQTFKQAPSLVSSSNSPLSPSFPDTSTIGYELDRIEIKLRNGMKAFLYVPVPLPHGEKERIKKYIDLLLEEDSEPFIKGETL